MKKKVIALLLATVMTTGLLAGCGDNETKETESTTKPDGEVVEDTSASEEAEEPIYELPETLSGKLKLWSFTNEVLVHALAFQERYPDVELEFMNLPMDTGEYQQKLKASLGTADAPDVIALEGAFIREFVESPYLEDLSWMTSRAESLGMYKYTMEAGTDTEGVLRAVSYQACPGAFYYRRSLAKEYFGTDDPDQVQLLLSDMNKFKEAAKTIKEKSNGDAYIVPGTAEFVQMYLTNRDQGWVVDGKLDISPKVKELMEVAKEFKDNGWMAEAEMWSEGWYAGMKDELVDANGVSKKIFGYFLPTWGLTFVLTGNAGDTAGDWACVPGPSSYRQGGTWIATVADTPNKEVADAFVAFCTTDEQNLTNWATGVYTNDYIKNIKTNIEVPEGLAQAGGDFVGCSVLAEKIAPMLDESPVAEFLGGQNAYTGFLQAAPRVSGKTMQGTDYSMEQALSTAITEYVNNGKSYDEAIAIFKDSVRTAEPDVIVE